MSTWRGCKNMPEIWLPWWLFEHTVNFIKKLETYFALFIYLDFRTVCEGRERRVKKWLPKGWIGFPILQVTQKTIISFIFFHFFQFQVDMKGRWKDNLFQKLSQFFYFIHWYLIEIELPMISLLFIPICGAFSIVGKPFPILRFMEKITAINQFILHFSNTISPCWSGDLAYKTN